MGIAIFLVFWVMLVYCPWLLLILILVGASTAVAYLGLCYLADQPWVIRWYYLHKLNQLIRKTRRQLWTHQKTHSDTN